MLRQDSKPLSRARRARLSRSLGLNLSLILTPFPARIYAPEGTARQAMLWQDSKQVRQTLEAVFNTILDTRMRGMPVINAELSVQAVGFSRFNEDWLGVLLTPWFMNLLLLPGPDSTWRELSPTTKFEAHFPYGVFEFTLADEAQLGPYAQCSLFSPMFQFENQAAALATAQAALQGLLTGNAPRNVSRRDILRGAVGNGNR